MIQRNGKSLCRLAGFTLASGVMAGGLGALAGCADYPTTVHGVRGNVWPGLPPTLIIRNESATPVRIFPMIGKINAFDPSGASDFNRKNTFDVAAGCVERYGLGSALWSTAAQDGIVRIGVLPLDEHGRAPTDHEAQTRWYEFERPHPYDLRITGSDEDGTGPILIESIGEGGIVELATPGG